MVNGKRCVIQRQADIADKIHYFRLKGKLYEDKRLNLKDRTALNLYAS